MRSAHILLLTGLPGVGKTTVIRRLAELLDGEPFGGFYTAEIRVGGERRGFRLVSFAGGERVIAHVDFRGRPRVGRYGVDVAALDAAAPLLAARAEAPIVLVDEIGKMECLSDRLVAALRALLDSDRLVVATVARRGEGFIAEARRWPGSELWEVTRDNRERLPAEACAWVRARRPAAQRAEA